MKDFHIAGKSVFEHLCLLSGTAFPKMGIKKKGPLSLSEKRPLT
jgi:hypothetical protein